MKPKKNWLKQHDNLIVGISPNAPTLPVCLTSIETLFYLIEKD
jgi:hypothetical protein